MTIQNKTSRLLEYVICLSWIILISIASIFIEFVMEFIGLTIHNIIFGQEIENFDSINYKLISILLTTILYYFIRTIIFKGIITKKQLLIDSIIIAFIYILGLKCVVIFSGGFYDIILPGSFTMTLPIIYFIIRKLFNTKLSFLYLAKENLVLLCYLFIVISLTNILAGLF